jgi:phosphopantetheinyl transferase
MRRELAPDLWLLEGVGREERPTAARRWLADALGCSETRVRLRRTTTGKPVVIDPPGSGFSVSYSGALMLLGLARSGEVGVDLEIVRSDLPLTDVAESFFAWNEVMFLSTQPSSLRPLAFYALWTSKEALLKVAGGGIVSGMREPRLPAERLTPLLQGGGDVGFQGGGDISVRVLTRMTGSGPVVAAQAFREWTPAARRL